MVRLEGVYIDSGEELTVHVFSQDEQRKFCEAYARLYVGLIASVFESNKLKNSLQHDEEIVRLFVEHMKFRLGQSHFGGLHPAEGEIGIRQILGKDLGLEPYWPTRKWPTIHQDTTFTGDYGVCILGLLITPWSVRAPDFEFWATFRCKNTPVVHIESPYKEIHTRETSPQFFHALDPVLWFRSGHNSGLAIRRINRGYFQVSPIGVTVGTREYLIKE